MALDRRIFLKSLGALGLATALDSAQARAFNNKNSKLEFLTQPYLQYVDDSEVSISVFTSVKSFCYLEVVDESGNLIETVYQLDDGMRNANATFFKFRVKHNNANFSYKVVSKEVLLFDPYKVEYGDVIETKIYKTNLPFLSEDTAHVLILNDVHEDVSTYKELYDHSELKRKDLVLLNGDSFHYVTKEKDLIEKLFIPVADVFASVTPFIMIRGNHETRGSFARDFKKYFDYPENKFYQSFTLGSTFWIILDGGEDKEDSHPVYAGAVDYDSYRLEQREWLQKELNSKACKSAKRVIVVNHIPFFHSDEWHGTLHNRSCFHDLLQKHKVTALISGHTHRYGYYPPDRDHNYSIFIGGGPKKGRRTYVEVVSSKKACQIVLKKDDGEIIGQLA